MPEKEIANAIPEASVSVTIEEGSVDGISHQAQVTPSSEDGVPDATFEASVAVTIEEGSVDGMSNQTQVASSSEDQVDEDLDQDWVDSIKEKHLLQPTRLKGSSIVKSCSIHRVPHRLRQHDEKAYVPHVISIGPFHYEKRKDQLRDMEEHKSSYLREIPARNGLECFENCLKAVKKLEKDARACYSEEIDLSSNDFVEMMVVDGCFLIELFSRKWYPFLRREGDPLLPPNWLRTSLICDLMMLENQIPFFILEKLFKIMKIRGASLVKITCRFFRVPVRQHETPIQHILHLLHSSDSLPVSMINNRTSSSIRMIKCASKLSEAGVELKMTRGNFWDMKFKNGALEMPTLCQYIIVEPCCI